MGLDRKNKLVLPLLKSYRRHLLTQSSYDPKLHFVKARVRSVRSQGCLRRGCEPNDSPSENNQLKGSEHPDKPSLITSVKVANHTRGAAKQSVWSLQTQLQALRNNQCEGFEPNARELQGTPGNPRELQRTLRKSRELPATFGNSRALQELHGSRENTKEHQGTQSNSKEVQGTQENCTELYESRRNSMKNQGTPTTPGVEGTPRNSTEANLNIPHFFWLPKQMWSFWGFCDC